MDFKFIASVFETLRISPPPKLILIEARTLADAHVPPYPPDMPVLLTGVDTRELADRLKEVLLTAYPKAHVIQVVHGDRVNLMTLGELENMPLGETTSWFIASLGEGASFDSFTEIVAHLRAPTAVRGTASRLMNPCGNTCWKSPMKPSPPSTRMTLQTCARSLVIYYCKSFIQAQIANEGAVQHE